jgi:FkbM family methyltransferase
MILHLEEWIDSQIYFTGYYEVYETLWLQNRLLPGQVFIDVGANIGYYSLIAAKAVGHHGKVICFEPLDRNYKCLKENLELNNFSNIITINKALSFQSDVLKLHFDPTEKNAGMAQVNEGGSFSIEAITLDHYFINQNALDVHCIKIDIEGHEYEALQGMEATLRKFKPMLMIEFDDLVFQDRKNTIELSWMFLIELGYAPHELDINGKLLRIEKMPAQRNKNYIFLEGKVR